MRLPFSQSSLEFRTANALVHSREDGAQGGRAQEAEGGLLLGRRRPPPGLSPSAPATCLHFRGESRPAPRVFPAPEPRATQPLPAVASDPPTARDPAPPPPSPRARHPTQRAGRSHTHPPAGTWAPRHRVWSPCPSPQRARAHCGAGPAAPSPQGWQAQAAGTQPEPWKSKGSRELGGHSTHVLRKG